MASVKPTVRMLPSATRCAQRRHAYCNAMHHQSTGPDYDRDCADCMAELSQPAATVANAWDAGFRHIGSVSGYGPQPTGDDGILTFGGRTIRTLQSGHATITVTVDHGRFDRTLIAALFGPLYALAWDARRIDPHWYLRGDE